MTIALSLNNFWQQCTPVDPPSPRETLSQFPAILGQGYTYGIELRPELSLTIRQHQLRDRVIVHNHPREHPIEFGFKRSGYVEDEYGNPLCGNDNILVGGVEPGGKVKWDIKEPITNLSIHIKLDLLYAWIAPEIQTFPKPLQAYFHQNPAPYYCVGKNTPAMNMALSQIFHCPYQGMTRHIYLESKVLELITLKLEQMQESNTSLSESSALKKTDVDAIVYAKEILLQHIDHPPSLMELARQVGLNDRKLKQGFRKVFGSTVFGYLHHYRLEQARFLLTETSLSVAQVARKVGYSNLSAFSTAFRKKYGINPRTYARSANLVKDYAFLNGRRLL